MTSDRPYRRALPPETAIQEIRHCARTQFDPEIVQALAEALGETLPTIAGAPAIDRLEPWSPNDLAAELSNGGRDSAQLWAAAGFTLSRLLDVSLCDLHSLRDDGDLDCVASIRAGSWYPQQLGPSTHLSSSTLAGEAKSSRMPVLVSSAADARLSERERAEMRRWAERARALVPLIAKDEVVGLAEIGETRDGRTITPEQLDTAESACKLIAMAVRDAKIIADQKVESRRLASLLESSRAVAAAKSSDDALSVVTRKAGELFDLTGCIAYEFDREHDTLVARALWETAHSAGRRVGEAVTLADDPAERDLLMSGGVRLECASDPELDPASRAVMELWRAKSCLTVVMQSVDGPMGLLTLWDSTRERGYSDEELALAISLAELAGETVRGAKLLRRLQGLSETDSLTGLANHRKIHEHLALAHARAERYHTRFSVAMLDIDNFKPLNDTHGHQAGDAVLRQVAGLLREQTRASDIPGRCGGDEFLLILPETEPAEAASLADKLRTELASRPYVTPAGEPVRLSVSIGIAAYPLDGRTAEELLAVADANLYASKRRGGDAVSSHDEIPLHDAERSQQLGSIRVESPR